MTEQNRSQKARDIDPRIKDLKEQSAKRMMNALDDALKNGTLVRVPRGGVATSYHPLRLHALDQFIGYCKAFPSEVQSLLDLGSIIGRDGIDPFLRSTMIGHITTSALVVDPDKRKILLIFHKVLQRWLQPGGHFEREDPITYRERPMLRSSAMREAIEETSVTGLEAHQWHEESNHPFDIDSHLIPANPKKDEGDHYHHDFLYLFCADSTKAIAPQLEEVTNATWLDFEPFSEIKDKRFVRVANKLSNLGF